MKIEKQIATRSSIKILSLRHMLYSQKKKGQLTIKEYLSKVKSMCDVLSTPGSVVYDNNNKKTSKHHSCKASN